MGKELSLHVANPSSISGTNRVPEHHQFRSNPCVLAWPMPDMQLSPSSISTILYSIITFKFSPKVSIILGAHKKEKAPPAKL